VAWRLVWFREEHPTWGIETEQVGAIEGACLFKAVIKDESGRVLATGHKSETHKKFPDYREKAETGAIGRALASFRLWPTLIFGGDELDEGERIVDSPLSK